MNSQRYFLREIAINFFSNPLVSLSAVTTVLMLQLLIGTFVLCWINLDHWTRSVTRQLQIVAFLKDDISSDERAEAIKQIRLMAPVRDVRFVDRQEAFSQLQKELQGKVTLEDLGENPLPDRLDVSVKDASTIPQLAEQISKGPAILKVRYGGDIAKRLMRISHSTSIVGSTLSLLLAFASVTVIGNTIRVTVYSRREEIEIMQMVGATRYFIQVPFVAEGILQGLSGTLIALIIIAFGYDGASLWLQENIQFLPPFPLDELLVNLSLAMLGFGALVGATGSALAVRRYLKV